MGQVNGGKPNVLWIFSDQHQAQAMSCYGDENIHTPNLDRLAAEGARFTRAYSNTPLCSPFRTSLYTGQYITTHGVVSLHVPFLRQPGQKMLAEVLQENGYHTSHMGKWHISGGAAPTAFVPPYFRPGWDDWSGWENSNRPWETWYTEGDAPKLKVLPGYQTDALTDMTVEWIGKQPADRPWFHVVSIEPPHPPNTAPEKYEAMFRDKPLKFLPNVPTDHRKRAKIEETARLYYAQIANLDDNVGRMLTALEEAGQLDNTIVFYFSDHGDMMGSHGDMGKSQPEQESSNIPLIVRYPKRIQPGTVSDAYISGVDFMPTLLGMLGIAPPEGMDGEDLSPAVYGERQDGARNVLLQYEKSFYAPAPEKSFRTLLQDEWKYTCFLTKGPAQLFYLQDDPYELNNRIHDPACAEIRGRMHEELRAKLAAFGDDFLSRMEILV
ncbi:MAG: hypothetical protein K0R75_1128 [Paenibacillaceae bacterium]|jgi:arylsulfatase A-like enzyme|nr:hypothetical protein [Paenibacillaceae bacterium]